MEELYTKKCEINSCAIFLWWASQDLAESLYLLDVQNFHNPEDVLLGGKSRLILRGPDYSIDTFISRDG